MQAEIFSFDEEAKTVLGDSEGICEGTVGVCKISHISETEIWHKHKDGTWLSTRTLDRMTGGYIISQPENTYRGTCVPFKKAF